jgi:predicted transposase/invertase (TIGR01784 family)
MKLLSPLQDLVFKRIFGDERNADILSGLLSTILDLPQDEYAGIEFCDPYLKPARKDGKLAILDVKVRTKSGSILNIEIQVLRFRAMPERVLYYASKLIADQLDESDRWYDLRRVISIVILDYDLLPDEGGYHNVFRLLNAGSHRPFTNLLELHTIELRKLPPAADGSPLEVWGRFLKADSEGEFTMLAQADPMIGKAYGVLWKMSADEQARYEVGQRERAQRDFNSIVGDAIEVQAELEAAQKELAAERKAAREELEVERKAAADARKKLESTLEGVAERDRLRTEVERLREEILRLRNSRE